MYYFIFIIRQHKSFYTDEDPDIVPNQAQGNDINIVLSKITILMSKR